MWPPGSTKASARAKLQPRHARLFSGSALFERLGRLLCRSGPLVPRKELFETWAFAVMLHDYFRPCRRVADLAAGHGLLGWCLLLLDQEDSEPSVAPRTVICLDRRMPPSADALADAILGEWPALEGRWTFVEAHMSRAVPDRSCLLASVHACGSLSDQVVAMAIESGAPVGLVPCCHSSKQFEPHSILRGGDEPKVASLLRPTEGVAGASLEQVQDRLRAMALREAGFRVRTESVPSELTDKNTVILAEPASTQPVRARPSTPHPRLDATPSLRRGAVALRVPLADTDSARALCDDLGGRRAALARRLPPPPEFDVSVWLPPGRSITEAAMEEVAREACAQRGEENVRVHVTGLDVFAHSSGRLARTFRVSYCAQPGRLCPERADEVNLLAEEWKAAMLAAHQDLQGQLIEENFPGSEVRRPRSVREIH